MKVTSLADIMRAQSSNSPDFDGDGLGGEAWGNRNGGAVGIGLTTPGVSPITGSFGTLIPNSA